MTLSIGYIDPQDGDDWQVISPGAVLNKMRELDHQVVLTQQALSAHLSGGGPLASEPELVAGWASYYAEWRSFYEDNDDWLSRFTSSVVVQFRSYMHRYNALERQLRAAGLTVATPSEEDVASGSWTKALIVGGVVVVGIFGLAWLVRESSGFVREGRDIYETERSRGTFRMRSSSGHAPPAPPPPRRLLLSR